MILQALVEHYEALEKKGVFPPFGFGKARVSYAVYIDDDGNIKNIVPIGEIVKKKDKEVSLPKDLVVPYQPQKTSNVSPGFLCGNSAYIFGIDSRNKGKKGKSLERAQKKTEESFKAAKKLHIELLEGTDAPVARALMGYWKNWSPEGAEVLMGLCRCEENYKELISGRVNIVFRYKGQYCHDCQELKDIWLEHYKKETESADMGICLVTGKPAPIARTHPHIMGVKGANPSGAALVSFDKDAFCSYGRTQSMNAPTGSYAAFAYTTALNHLLADFNHRYTIGDTTFVFWSKTAEDAYADFMEAAVFGSQKYTEEKMRGFMQSLAGMERVEFDKTLLDPAMDFYILGLSPNSGRIFVRFFARNSFGDLARNINEHYDRMEIVSGGNKDYPYASMSTVINETVNPKSKSKKASPILTGELTRSILMGTAYPVSLLNGIAIRIRADRVVNRTRAGIIKAYYTKNRSVYVPEEVLQMSLNPESSSIPYQLGRLFSVLEDIQQKANPGINKTIRDRYFNSASSTPAAVFPTLIELSQKHLKKLGTNKGLKIMLEKQMGEIMDHFGTNFPRQLTFQEQGSFQLGYYHQTQARYQKKDKEEKSNV